MRLLEREGARDAILAALKTAAGGTGTTLLFLGAPGVGKTSVLTLARSAASSAGYRIATGVGSPTERRLPFGVIGQALAALDAEAMVDAEELARLGGRPARLYRTLRLLAARAAETPLLLALDDLHWADADSLELLEFVCRRLAGTRILVLGALRSEPAAAAALAQELAASGQATVLRLQPLSRPSAVRLLTDCGASEGSERDRAVDACGGSPLLLKLAAAALGTGAPLPAPGPSGTGFGQRLLLERFVGLGEPAFEYVRAAAILGVRFPPALAGALAGLDEEAWLGCHGRLVNAGLLDDLDGEQSTFVHPLFAQALVDSLAPAARQRAHARAFRLLARAGEPDAVAVEHAVRGGLVGDQLAVQIAWRGGREALAQGALASAHTLMTSAVALAGPAASVELLLDHATALSARGRLDDARRACEALLERTGIGNEPRSRVLTLLARMAVVGGNPVSAERLYEAAAEAVRDDPANAAAVLADAAVTCHIASPTDWVSATVERALELGGPRWPMRRLLMALRAYSLLLGGDPDGARMMGEAIPMVDEIGHGDRDWGWTIAVHALNACKLTEDLEGATRVFERAFASAVEDGAPMLINALAISYADVMHRLGRPLEALELVRSAGAVSELQMAPWFDLACAVLLTELGRDAEAASHLEALRAVRRSITDGHHAPVSLWLDLLDARLALADGAAEAASELMLDAACVARASGWRHPCIVPWADVAVEAHLAAGRPQLASSTLADVEALARPLGCRWPAATLALGRARLAAAEGRRDEADLGFRRAVEELAPLALPIAHAEALVAQGEHLRRTGRPREARAPLAQALRLAERSSAGRVARRARAELAACGGRRRRRDDAQAPSLTAQQQRIAQLAGRGLTNAQIAGALTISPKTVDNHLQQIYAALGIHSRRELIIREHRADDDQATNRPRASP
ncbi:MAG TPA: LuxR family transcriptional regulator [Solirubrobacteraceae bacterium]|nr:LuxR family transcriptional regulator [Solirubrobacteraceae bacterium]